MKVRPFSLPLPFPCRSLLDPFSSPTHIGRKSAKATKRKPMTPSDSTHLETELQALRKHLRPIPFVPRKTLDFAHHETLLRNLGLWDFLHLEFDRHIRTDLLEQLIATYDPKRHHSCRSRVNGVPIRLSRAHLARALKLEVKRCRKNSNEAVDCESKVVSDDEVLFLEALVSNWVVLLDDNCASPAEVSKSLSFIKERKLHMVDWAGLVWFMVERELSKGPELIHCHYASHLQLLLKFQRPRLFEGGFVDVVVNPGGVKMEGSDDFEGQESKNLQTSDELGHGEYGMEPKMEEVVNDFKIGGSDSCGMESVQGKSDAEPNQEEVLIDVRFGGCVDFCQMELEDNRVELNLVQVMNEKKPQTEDSVEEKVDVVDENLGGSEDFHNVPCLKLEQGKIENESVEEVKEDDIMDSEECKEKEGEDNRTESSLVLGKDEKELNTEDSVEENEDVVDENSGSSKDLDRAGLESSGTCLNLEQGKIESENMEEVKEDDVTDLEECKEKERENNQMEVILVQEKNEMELNMEDSMVEKEDGVDENLGGSKDLHMAELETSGTYLILEQGKIENENVEEVKEDHVIDLEEFKEKEGESNEMELSLVWDKNEKEPNMEDIVEEKEDMVDENLGGPKDFHRAELENNKTYLNLEQGKIENENVEEGKEDGVIDLEECKEKEGENGQMEVGLVQEKIEMDLNREDSEEEKEDMVDENLGGSEDFYMVELENLGTCLNLEQGKIENESAEKVKEDDVIDLEECQEKGQIWLNQKKDISGLFLQQCSLNQFGELKLHPGRKEVSEEQSDDDLFMEQPPSDTLSLPDLVQSMGTKDPYNALPVPTHIINDSYQESTSRMNTLVRMDGSSMYGNPLKRKNDYEGYFSTETWESKLDTNMKLGGPSVFDNSLKTERSCHNVQAHSLNASQKRMKIDGPWEEKSMDFSFCMEQIASWMAKAKIAFAEREQACISAEMNRQMLVNEIKHRDNIIQLCEKTKHEELQKREGVICRLEHDVCFMENLLGDYRRALKETRKTFAKYRQRCPCPHPALPLYRDVAGSGGAVLSVKELGKRPLESDRFYEIKPSMIEEKISEFQLKWVGKLEAHLVKVFLLNERLQVVEEEAKLLKETCLKALNF